MSIIEITIENNIPAPVKYNWRINLDKLEIGESFPFPKDKSRAVSTVIHRDFHTVNNKRFTIGDDPKDETGNKRVWRTEDVEKSEDNH